jgi:hypothetical protein
MIFFAYIDPGTGLLAWQALVAAFLGTLFYLKRTRTWLVGLFLRLFRIGKPPTGDASAVTAPRNDLG